MIRPNRLKVQRKFLIMRSLLNTQIVFTLPFVRSRENFVLLLLLFFVVKFRKRKRTAALSRTSGCLSQNMIHQIFLSETDTTNVFILTYE